MQVYDPTTRGTDDPEEDTFLQHHQWKFDFLGMTEEAPVPVGEVPNEAKHVLSKLTSLLDLAVWFNERFRAADEPRLRTSSDDDVRSAVNEALCLAGENLGRVYPRPAIYHHMYDVSIVFLITLLQVRHLHLYRVRTV